MFDQLKDLDRETLEAMLSDFAKNWLAHDGLWFQAVEKHTDMKTAIEATERALELLGRKVPQWSITLYVQLLREVVVQVRERGQRAIAFPQRIRRREQPATTGEALGSGHRRWGHDDDRFTRAGIGLVLDDVASEWKIDGEVDRARVAVAA